MRKDKIEEVIKKLADFSKKNNCPPFNEVNVEILDGVNYKLLFYHNSTLVASIISDMPDRDLLIAKIGMVSILRGNLDGIFSSPDPLLQICLN